MPSSTLVEIRVLLSHTKITSLSRHFVFRFSATAASWESGRMKLNAEWRMEGLQRPAFLHARVSRVNLQLVYWSEISSTLNNTVHIVFFRYFSPVLCKHQAQLIPPPQFRDLSQTVISRSLKSMRAGILTRHPRGKVAQPRMQALRFDFACLG